MKADLAAVLSLDPSAGHTILSSDPSAGPSGGPPIRDTWDLQAPPGLQTPRQAFAGVRRQLLHFLTYVWPCLDTYKRLRLASTHLGRQIKLTLAKPSQV